MKEKVDILLLGRGGRESAIAAKLLESRRLGVLHTSPAQYPGAKWANIGPLDFQEIRDYCISNGIDLVFVGPEAPVVAGIKDYLQNYGIEVVAPLRDCGKLEGSKEFAKEFMSQQSIPTPRFMTVTSETVEEGIDFLESRTAPYVVKADGLAAGKGVMITESLEEAKFFMREMLDGLFEESSSTVVLEEFAKGTEVSLFLAVSGAEYRILTSARDYKKLYNGDKGPNTAGLGSLSPSPQADASFIEKVEKRIIIPTIRGLRDLGLDYKGFLYLGLMDCEGFPMLLEYNVRLGDPETQAIMPRMESDLIDLLEAIVEGGLKDCDIRFSEKCSVGVVMAAEGYPASVKKGREVTCLDIRIPGVTLYQGSVRYDKENRCLVEGGRVATSVGIGENYKEAAENALKGAETVTFEGKYYRTDIGS